MCTCGPRPDLRRASPQAGPEHGAGTCLQLGESHGSKLTNNAAPVACPQDAEISAFELQTILRRVLAKRKCPRLASPSSPCFPCGREGAWQPFSAAVAEPRLPWLSHHALLPRGYHPPRPPPPPQNWMREALCDVLFRRTELPRVWRSKSHPGFHGLLDWSY